MRLPLLALLAAALAAAPAAAQRAAPAPDSSAADTVAADTVASAPVGGEAALPVVTVTAARVPLAPRDAPARVTVLDVAALPAAASVADLLGARAPVFVRRYGPSGLATLALRGTGGAQTLVLLDGQRLGDPQLGQVDLALLPTVLLSAVEVLHGPGAALHGTDALGGVVHLRSARPGARPAARLASEVGAWGQRRLGAVGTTRLRSGLGLVAAAEHERADDDFRYADATRLGAPLVRHAGWDRRRSAAYLAAEGAAGATRLHAAALVADAERGLGGTDSVGARQWDRVARLWAGAERPTAWGRLAVNAYAQRARLRYASPYPATRPGALDETGRTTTAGADALAEVAAPAGWRLTAHASAGVGQAAHPALASGARDAHAALALAAAPSRGRVRLYPAVRLDAYAPAGAARAVALSPQLGLNVAPLAGAPLRLKASAGRAFRMPTLNDRFWRPGGNPDLRPERALSADAGLAWAPGRLRLEATVFAAAARDQIVWRPGAGGVWAPENLARTRTRGLEATAAAALPLGPRAVLDGGLAATLTDARDRSDAQAPAYDQPLRYVPRWTAKAWAGLALGAVAGGDLRLDAAAQAAGRRYTASDGSAFLLPYAVLSGALAYARTLGGPAGLRATLALAVENAGDAAYEVVQAYVMPPRHARLRLTLETAPR